ncbi:MAG: hypothetical protein GY944_17535 [bacterium]|nr:hypothetical protein [bacterium]MCP5042830.1 hypothetical protein [bacterium]
MITSRYSRWDGTQKQFRLDAQSALDAMSDLMMEGLSAQEALEWMQRMGFELAGLNMRVMGLDEIQQELQDALRDLYNQYSMDEALPEMQQRLDEILDREQETLQREHGYESSAMNDFLDRRHRERRKTSEQIEDFRDYPFEDEQAARDFAELLGELDSLRQLEEFLQQRGERFRGDEAADYEQAQQIRERIQGLEQLMQQLASGDLEGISSQTLSELLGDEAGESLMLIQSLENQMRDEGLLRGQGDDLKLTPRAIRQMGASALADVYRMLKRDRSGEHDTSERGVAMPRPDETRSWEYGDSLDLDIVKTVLNGVKRRVAAGLPGTGAKVALDVEDFEVRETDCATQTTTILLLDLSWSMSWAGRFPAAKRVAMALDHLIRTRYPRDHFAVVGFSTRAREIPIGELPEVCWDMGDPFTNLQQGLMVAEDLIRKKPSSSPQILVITDGQPTAYFDEGQLRVEWPNGLGGVSPHAVAATLATVRRVSRRGITINTFMLDDAPELVGFVERMTQINHGRAFYTHPSQIGSFMMVDYVTQRRRRR